MVDFKTRIYTESEDDIIGAEVLVYSDNGDRIGSIEIVNAEDLNDLREQLSVIDETYFTESRLNAILANAQETTNINATELSGFASSDFAKVTQLSNYALSNHTHVKTNISDLYNYSISCSDYNPTIDSEISVTVKVTNQAGNPISGQSISIAKNNVAWKNGVTGSNGEFTTTYTCSEWGLVTFSAKNHNSLQILVKGFKKIYESTSGRYSLFVDESTRQARINLHFNGETITSGTGQYDVTGFVPTEYCPPKNVIAPIDRWNDFDFYLWSDGTIGVLNNSGSTKTLTTDVQVDYTF